MNNSRHFRSIVCLLAIFAAIVLQAASALPRETPESQGVRSEAILEFINQAETRLDALHTFMFLRHGRVIAEGWWKPYHRENRHELYSLSKSFTSTAIGFAVAEGRLSVDDPVLKFFPDDAPATPGANLKAMRVKDLLTMAAGHQDETSSGADRISARAFLNHPVPHKPGTHFKYNTPATFMLSAIIQKLTGQSTLDYLKPRLFQPLGIQDPVWDTNFEGISLGGYGLNVRTEDIARFGQLYLQKGRWEGRQLLPASWVEEATSKQVSNGSNPASDWDQGYGYQFWRCRNGGYRGDGAFGQYCIVLPGSDSVIAITSGLKDMQAVLNLVWDVLLPGIQPGKLPRNKAAHAALSARLNNLNLPLPSGEHTSQEFPKFAGKNFVFEQNAQKLESIGLESGNARELILVTRFNGKVQRTPCGTGEWKRSRLAFANFPEKSVSAAAAWTGPDALQIRMYFDESPYRLNMALKFEGNSVEVSPEFNVMFGQTALPKLKGEAR